jgi:hypothetical protein
VIRTAEARRPGRAEFATVAHEGLASTRQAHDAGLYRRAVVHRIIVHHGLPGCTSTRWIAGVASWFVGGKQLIFRGANPYVSDLSAAIRGVLDGNTIRVDGAGAIEGVDGLAGRESTIDPRAGASSARRTTSA